MWEYREWKGSADAIYSFGSKWELAGETREKMFIKKEDKGKKLNKKW
jgi:hypothetical protein